MGVQNSPTDSATSFFGVNAERFLSRYQNSPAFVERYQLWTEKLANYIVPEIKVLDIGCGPGVFSFFLATKNCKVMGIDGSAEMIALCNLQKKNHPNMNVSFKVDIFPFKTIPREYQDVQLVIASSVFEYINDLEAALIAVKMVLAPGGIFMLSMPNGECLYRKLERICFRVFKVPSYYKYVKHLVTPKQFNQLMKKHGFSCLDSAYYGCSFPNLIKHIFPLKRKEPLFLGIYKKVL